VEESGKEKWTPGPWSVQPNAHDVPCIVQGPNYRVAVAHRQENRPNEATAAANARLIAAAPALYEALRRVNGALRVIREHMDSTGKELSPVFDLADADTLLDVTKAALLLANTGETENG
jgi:hypothetical protein